MVFLEWTINQIIYLLYGSKLTVLMVWYVAEIVNKSFISTKGKFYCNFIKKKHYRRKILQRIWETFFELGKGLFFVFITPLTIYILYIIRYFTYIKYIILTVTIFCFYYG